MVHSHANLTIHHDGRSLANARLHRGALPLGLLVPASQALPAVAAVGAAGCPRWGGAAAALDG
jgi:hypothetical protein